MIFWTVRAWAFFFLVVIVIFRKAYGSSSHLSVCKVARDIFLFENNHIYLFYFRWKHHVAVKLKTVSAGMTFVCLLYLQNKRNEILLA